MSEGGGAGGGEGAEGAGASAAAAAAAAACSPVAATTIAEAPPAFKNLLESCPLDVLITLVEYLPEWRQHVRLLSRGTRTLCDEKALSDATRKWAMKLWKKGMDMANGSGFEPWAPSAGVRLVQLAARAGLRPARAHVRFEAGVRSLQPLLSMREQPFLHLPPTPCSMWKDEVDECARQTEASGGSCPWSAYFIGQSWENNMVGAGDESWLDGATALRLMEEAADKHGNRE